jgi:hypothetical protein
MISIIVCSRDKILLHKLETTIATTINVEYEIIQINNAENSYTICEAYNIGGKKAQYQILCFIHEDITIQTINWGNKILQHFENNTSIGVIGFAGSTYKSVIPSPWYAAGNNTIRSNIFQISSNETIHDLINPYKETISEVVVLDGVWLTVKKDIFNKVLFNEELLKGFHGYDLDFSIRAAKYCKLAVVYDIDIIHQSTGSFDNKWLEAQIAVDSFLTKKYGLPYYATTNIENELQKKLDKTVFKTTFKNICKQPKISMQSIKSWLYYTKQYMPIFNLFVLKYYSKALFKRSVGK